MWSFEDAIRALDKALDSLGTRRAPFPPELQGPGSGGSGDAADPEGGRDNDGDEGDGDEGGDS